LFATACSEGRGSSCAMSHYRPCSSHGDQRSPGTTACRAGGIRAIMQSMFEHPNRISRVACVGAGTIGARWAATFLFHGLDVVAIDPAPERETLVREHVANAWPLLERLGAPAMGAGLHRLRFERDLVTGVAGVEMVQESAPEREELKADLFR